MDGILLIDKPKHWTSHDVVAKVRNTLRKEVGVNNPKVGHTGTLDPLATGLLILTIGSYCKRASEFSKLDKIYEVAMRIGETSTTADSEGKKSRISARRPAKQEILTALKNFVGEIEQTPPAYSAIKVNGQRAYKLARAGKVIHLEPRIVTIFDISDINYTFPYIKFFTKVSSGTYIRSLVEDVGRMLETGAYMTDLRRVQIGDHCVVNAYAPTVGQLEVKIIHFDKK